MRALRVWISFFITHHFSLNFRHLSLIIRYLKYPNFPNPTRLALIIQFCVTLFPKKRKKKKTKQNKKVQHYGWALFQKKIKNKKKNKKKMSKITAGIFLKKKKKKTKKVQHCGWTMDLLQKCHWKLSFGNWKHL